MSRSAPRQLEILTATAEAAEDCAALHAGLFEPAWDAPSFRALLGQPVAVALLARLGTPPETVGFVLGQVAADQAEVLALGVRADRQRRGIGTQLIEALARAVAARQARLLYLDVDAGNTAALALYRGLGFEERGRRRGYYLKADAAAVDAVTLARAL
jgi:[ribosomal protein S18]-alanine N-acetyltransferase